MIEYRVKQVKLIENTGNATAYYFPQYRRSCFGFGWWSFYTSFVGTGKLTGACTNPDQAWNYINEQKDTNPIYHYTDEREK